MPTITVSRRLAVALAATATAALLFTGCSANPLEGIVDQGIEDAVEGATGGDVNLGSELPADFPTSVPLLDGEISFSGGAGQAEGWIVVITSSAADPVAEASAELEAAGFTRDTNVSGDSANAAVYSDDEYLVIVAADGENLSYTVTAAVQ